AFLKNGKAAAKTGDQDWKSLSELEAAAGTDPGPRQFLARRLQTYKAPAVELADLPSKTKDMKREADVFSGELTEAGAKELLSFGRRGGAVDGAKNAKGSVKVWVKDGTPVKYQLKLEGTVNFNGEDRDVNRTTTVEIKDVGSAKIEVPDAARKKLS